MSTYDVLTRREPKRCLPAPMYAVMGNSSAAFPRITTPLSERPAPDLSENPHSLHYIRDEESWRYLAAKPDTHQFAHSSVVKCVIDRKPHGKKPQDPAEQVHFLESKTWPLHYRWIAQNLLTPEDPYPHANNHDFNQNEYFKPNRRFVLLSVTRYEDQGIYTVELFAGDNLDGPGVQQVMAVVQQLVYFGDKLRYRPLSDLHFKKIASVQDKLAVVTSDELFGSIQFQPVTTGTAFGTLVIVSDPAALTALAAAATAPAASIERSAALKSDSADEKSGSNSDVASADMRALTWADKIVVTSAVPLDLPLVAGLITAELQTPLCHVALLSGNRGTPNISLKGAHTSDKLRALEGKLVRFTVDYQSYQLEESDEKTAQEWRAVIQRQKARDLEHMRANFKLVAPDFSSSRLVSLSEMTSPKTDAAWAGAKASQLASLQSTKFQSWVRKLDGFVIPFGSYRAHLRSACEPQLQELLSRTPRTAELSKANAPPSASDDTGDAKSNSVEQPKNEWTAEQQQTADAAKLLSVDELLDAIQNRIMSTPVEASLLESIATRLAAWAVASNAASAPSSSPSSTSSTASGAAGSDLKTTEWKPEGKSTTTEVRSKGVILRSSTNAEDLPGFNGAGLYLSEVLSESQQLSPNAIADALRRVWASVWSRRAYAERQAFASELGFGQDWVAMAVLAMPYLSEDIVHCNGVAITRNPFRAGLPGYFINTQVGSHKVTDGAGGRPEQILIYDIGDKRVSEVISRSELAKGKPLLAEDDLKRLFYTLETTHFTFMPRVGHLGANALDVEFLVLKDKYVVLLQWRPFTVHYHQQTMI